MPSKDNVIDINDIPHFIGTIGDLDNIDETCVRYVKESGTEFDKFHIRQLLYTSIDYVGGKQQTVVVTKPNELATRHYYKGTWYAWTYHTQEPPFEGNLLDIKVGAVYTVPKGVSDLPDMDSKVEYPPMALIRCNGYYVQVLIDPHQKKIYHRVLENLKASAWKGYPLAEKS